MADDRAPSPTTGRTDKIIPRGAREGEKPAGVFHMPGNWVVVATLAVLVTLLGVAVWVSRVVVRFLEHFRPTRVKVRVVEHKAQAGGSSYALLYEVLEPRELQGRYGLAATLRGDLVDGVDGVEFEVYLNWTMIGPLGGRPEGDYSISSPESKSGDFLEMAERVR